MTLVGMGEWWWWWGKDEVVTHYQGGSSEEAAFTWAYQSLMRAEKDASA